MPNVIYFNAARLQRLLDNYLEEGEVLKGYIITPGKNQNGQDVFFPYLRVEKDGKIIEKEVTDESYVGCPYPPACDDES